MYGLQALLHLSLKYIFKIKQIMKKILGFLAASVLVASCLGSAGFEADYDLFATFGYADADFIGDKTKPDSLLYDTDYRLGFVWDYFGFHHKVDQYTLDFEGGFLASCLKVPTTADVSGLSHNEYRANARGTKSVENKYAVFKQSYNMPEKHLSFIVTSGESTDAVCTMKYVYVTNTVAVEQAVKTSFVDGDKMVLKATGYLGTQQTGSAEIKLAEFTQEKDSVITSWTMFDLSALGSVDNVKFEIMAYSSKYIPTTVCMDDLSAHVSIKTK